MRGAHAGGVTAARGFLAAGVSSGIKRGKPDLALIVSERPAAAAGVLTTHRLAAAPVLLTRQSLTLGSARAILANSGNANCCTGPRGRADALALRRAAAQSLHVSPPQVLVASTGVIGRFLPVRRILKAIPKLTRQLDPRGSASAAQAILTTDLIPKSVSLQTRIQGRRVNLGGIAKGSGMIDPAMATMLCFLTTDCAVSPKALQGALREAMEDSFHAITVDGQMSTNDTVLLLANGAAGNRPLFPGAPGWSAFTDVLQTVSVTLARMIVRDGEGASRFITIRVAGGRSKEEARRVAKAIANAPLVKTMVTGADPNWGRVAAAVGAAGIKIIPEKLQIGLSGIVLFRKGKPIPYDRLSLKERFRKPEVSIEVDLGSGRGQAHVFTCDLTEEYVRINAKYS